MNKMRDFMINGWQGVTKPSSDLKITEVIFEYSIRDLDINTKINVSDGLTAIKTEEGLAYYIAGYKLAFKKYKANGFKTVEVDNVESLYEKIKIKKDRFIKEAYEEWNEAINKMDDSDHKSKLLEFKEVIVSETMKCNFIEGFNKGISDLKELFGKVA